MDRRCANVRHNEEVDMLKGNGVRHNYDSAAIFGCTRGCVQWRFHEVHAESSGGKFLHYREELYAQWRKAHLRAQFDRTSAGEHRGRQSGSIKSIHIHRLPVEFVGKGNADSRVCVRRSTCGRVIAGFACRRYRRSGQRSCSGLGLSRTREHRFVRDLPGPPSRCNRSLGYLSDW